MIFDPNQNEFPSKHHETVWKLGRRIVPFEISTAEIKDGDMLEWCRQFHGFTVELFEKMYRNPALFKIGEKRTAIRKGKPSFEFEITPESIHLHMRRYNPISINEETNSYQWVMETNGPSDSDSVFADDIYNLDILANAGVQYEIDGKTVTAECPKYPLLPKYFASFWEACKKFKIGMGSYFPACDFKFFNDKYKRTIDDTMRHLSDRDKKLAMELHDYLAEKRIKPKIKPHLDYEYKNKTDFRLLRICDPPIMQLRIPLGNYIGDEQYKQLFIEIEEQDNKEELLAYIVANIQLCGGCCTAWKQCRPEIDFLGKRLRVCGCILNKHLSESGGKYYDDHDIAIIKQIIDLRIKAIDNITSK